MTEQTVLQDGTALRLQGVIELAFDGQDDSPSGEIIGHIGGKGIVPADAQIPAMPTRDGERETLSHLATFSTAMLTGVAPNLPKGEIVLLYASSDQPWSYLGSPVEEMRDGHRVIFLPEGAPRVVHEGGAVWPERKLVGVGYNELVPPADFDILAVSDEACDEWDELNEERAGAAFGDLDPAIRVFGRVEAVQNEMPPQLPALGEAVHGMATREDDWVCIATVLSLDMHMAGASLPGSWMWGDCGSLYFWITRQDLEAVRFDRTICILQCM